jgi:hypothetical protein
VRTRRELEMRDFARLAVIRAQDAELRRVERRDPVDVDLHQAIALGDHVAHALVRVVALEADADL